MTSSGNSIFLNFNSDLDKDGSFGYLGFSLEYRFICGEEKNQIWDHCKSIEDPMLLADAEGHLIFSRDQYKHNLRCGWLFQNTNSTCRDPRVEIEFTSFSTEFSFDFVELYEGKQRNQSNLVGRFTGPLTYDGPGYYRSQGDSILVVFHTDSGNNPGADYEGFEMSYKMVCGPPKYANCPSQDSPRVFEYDPASTSPRLFVFDQSHYLNRLDCFWIFRNSNPKCKAGGVTLLDFTKFNTEEKHDQVRIYDGSNIDAFQMGTWSGPITIINNGPGFQRSSGSDLLVRFTTDRSANEFEGFSIIYDFQCTEDLPEVKSACPREPRVISAEGELALAAEHYKSNIDCSWIVQNNRSDCPAGQTPVIDMNFIIFHTEHLFDFFSISEGESIDPLDTKTFSGNHTWEVPGVQRSKTNKVTLMFHTDGTVDQELDKDAFRVRFTSSCSGDPLPQSEWDCSGDNLAPHIKISTSKLSDVVYGHYTIPFTIGYPVMNPNAFTNPREESTLEYRGATGIEGEVAFGLDIPEDPTNPVTSVCCGLLNMSNPKNNVTGKIAVCDRGSCLFVTKARVVQSLGAIGLVVVNYNEDGLKMSSTVGVDDIVIPSIAVRNSFGNLLRTVAEEPDQKISLKIGAYDCPSSPKAPTAPTPPPSVPAVVPGIVPAPSPQPTRDTSPVVDGYAVLNVKKDSFDQGAFVRGIQSKMGLTIKQEWIVKAIPSPDDDTVTLLKLRTPASVIDHAKSLLTTRGGDLLDGLYLIYVDTKAPTALEGEKKMYIQVNVKPQYLHLYQLLSKLQATYSLISLRPLNVKESQVDHHASTITLGVGSPADDLIAMATRTFQSGTKKVYGQVYLLYMSADPPATQLPSEIPAYMVISQHYIDFKASDFILMVEKKFGWTRATARVVSSEPSKPTGTLVVLGVGDDVTRNLQSSEILRQAIFTVDNEGGASDLSSTIRVVSLSDKPPEPAETSVFVTVNIPPSELDTGVLLGSIEKKFKWTQGVSRVIRALPSDDQQATVLELAVRDDDESASTGEKAISDARNVFLSSGGALDGDTQILAFTFQKAEVSATCPLIVYQECIPDSLENAWIEDCQCKKSLTAAGSFLFVIVPLLIVVGCLIGACLYLPVKYAYHDLKLPLPPPL